VNALALNIAGAFPADDTVAAIVRTELMSAAWDEMATYAFTDEARYQAAKSRFASLSKGDR
jgi:hypothetical protein